MESPLCRPSKRARASNSAQVPSCLVDGCNSDLSKCRDYHRRHKVCELHSKTPKVTIRGEDQRFCQQCSRFHSLGEFDDAKRSCRKRLDGHNRRRRKAQSDPSISSSGLLTNIQGTTFIPFSSPQLFPASALGRCPSNGILKPENNYVLYSGNSSSSGHHQLNFSDKKLVFSTATAPSHSNKPQIQFPFMQGRNDLRIGSSVCGTSLDPNTMSGNNSGCCSHKILPSCLMGPLNSIECALSLLSLPLPAAAQASHHKDGGTTMQFDLLEPPNSMPTLHYNRTGAYDPTGSFLQASDSLNGMFRIRHDGSSAGSSRSHPTPSFTWGYP